MNINKIRNKYDPENDYAPVSWVDMELAEEVISLQKDLTRCVAVINNLQDQVLIMQKVILRLQKLM